MGDVLGELYKAREVFIEKATEQARHMAWVIAVIYSKVNTTVADQRGARGTRPLGKFFFHFHAVLEEIWPNSMLAPPPWDWRPPSLEILDPPLILLFWFSAPLNFYQWKIIRIFFIFFK